MNSFYLDIILNHSIAIPAIAGIIRWRGLKSYYPFLLFLWVGLLNETLSLFFIFHSGNNAINSNIYVLIEYGILLYQFYIWQKKGSFLIVILGIIGFIIWMTDNVIVHSLSQNNSLFRCFYSFVILVYSIDRINMLILSEKRNLTRNASYTICIAFILYYGYKTLLEAFNIFEQSIQVMFDHYLWLILEIINCISNLLFTLAILWNPKKQSFIEDY